MRNTRHHNRQSPEARRYGGQPRWPRRRYGRRLLWRGEDAWGEVEVVKSPLGAAMHFGSASLQGRLCLNEPWLPVAEYAVTMAGLAALPAPVSRVSDSRAPLTPQVCLLGLGTGSLAWTYQHLLPSATLTALELRPAVIEAARACMRLDELSALRVIEGDADQTITTLEERSQTLIAVDLFTAQGMAEITGTSHLWRSVSRVLHPSGALCVNAWSGDLSRFRALLSLLERWVCPGGSLLSIDHLGFGNVVIFATPRPLEGRAMLTRASRVDQLLTPAQAWSRSMYREAERVGLSGESIMSRLRRASFYH